VFSEEFTQAFFRDKRGYVEELLRRHKNGEPIDLDFGGFGECESFLNNLFSSEKLIRKMMKEGIWFDNGLN